jgi:hypothetical protein
MIIATNYFLYEKQIILDNSIFCTKILTHRLIDEKVCCDTDKDFFSCTYRRYKIMQLQDKNEKYTAYEVKPVIRQSLPKRPLEEYIIKIYPNLITALMDMNYINITSFFPNFPNNLQN